MTPKSYACMVFICLLLAACTPPSEPDMPPAASPEGPAQKVVLKPADKPFEIDPETRNNLQALGYMGGYDPMSDTTGVQHYDPQKTCPGINLIVSGHHPEILLMDAAGRVLHTWEFPRFRAFPDGDTGEDRERSRSFRRAHVLPNGDVLGVYNGMGMVRLDADSELIWAQDAPCHHDVTPGPDGTLYTIAQNRRIFADLNTEEPVIDECIVQLDAATGSILRQISLLDAFKNSVYAPYLKKIPNAGDVLHANTVVYIDAVLAATSPVFTENHVLVSIRNMDTIAILDPHEQHIVWAMTGMWSFQHEPGILPSGNILLFDNVGHHGRSKVLEFNPQTQSVIWQYADSPETPLFSATSGTCHRLTNGNTLIVESNRGYALEVSRDGETVWDYLNPGTWGPRNDLRGTLFDVVRISPDTFTEEFRKRLSAL